MEILDCIIVGAGPAGIFSAYELHERRPDLKVLLIDKGHDIYHRQCPVLNHQIKKCPVNKNGVSGCNPACSITNGFGGAGGSGGGAGGYYNLDSGDGGSYGNSGGNREHDNYGGGEGQETTTSEFGEGSLTACDRGEE